MNERRRKWTWTTKRKKKKGKEKKRKRRMSRRKRQFYGARRKFGKVGAEEDAINTQGKVKVEYDVAGSGNWGMEERT